MALALGVADLAAAIVAPQASPIIAVGRAFIDRTPWWLKNFAVEKFGENAENMLLLGLFVILALIAILIGMIAWRSAIICLARWSRRQASGGPEAAAVSRPGTVRSGWLA
jgi:hypothetical protein